MREPCKWAGIRRGAGRTVGPNARFCRRNLQC
jgi:hypothetical protein